MCVICANKNKKYSKEYRRKRSIAFSGENNPMYGKNHSKETKEKISKINSGKKRSEKTKEKMSKSHIGKKHSEETKQKMSGKNNPMYGIHRFGKDSPSWLGGISFTPYCVNFNNKIKEQIRDEFNRKCFLCGILENNCKVKLSIHHIDYDKNQGCNSINWDLIPLCNSCHPKTSGKYIRDYYEELFSRLLYIRELIFEYENKIDYRSI